MEEAIRLGSEEVKDPRYEGRIFPHTIDDCSTKLAEFKTKIK